MVKSTEPDSKIEIASLNNECYKRIKQDILVGKLGWGERLNVISMALIYGVSRSPVIKAIERLEMERLVRIIPNVGSFVIIPTKEDVGEVTEIRLMLETTMCRLAYAKNKEPLLRRLKETGSIIEAETDEEKMQKFDYFLEYDRGFHALFSLLSENERLRVYYDSIRTQIELFRTKTYFRQYVDLALERHFGIIEALERDLLDEALGIMKSHIREVEAETLESIEKNNTVKEYR
jgi:DNA-binding GntR family transcriptional regulator